MDYRVGRSAMILYACTDPDETLRRLVEGRGARQIERAVSAGARWIRYAESPAPRAELDRLLKGFVERFGSPPINNVGAGKTRNGRGDEE